MARAVAARGESRPNSPSSLVKDLDPAVERAILWCLEPEPDRRPRSALAVAAALPGGDPLAAAIEAGATPSPEIVAGAGETMLLLNGRLSRTAQLALVDRLKRGEASAAELIEDLELSKANLSKHMALLTRGGIVESRREGRQLHYRLTDPEIHEACAIMRSVLYRRLKQGEKLASAIHSAAAPLSKAH